MNIQRDASVRSEFYDKISRKNGNVALVIVTFPIEIRTNIRQDVVDIDS